MNIVYKFIYPVLGLIVVSLIVIIGIIVVRDAVSNSTDSTTSNNQTGNEKVVTNKDFTIEEVGVGNNKENCLIAYSGEVFLVPASYFREHPGGSSAILRNCGTDATQEFDRAHTGNQSAYNMLKDFKVGTLVESNPTSAGSETIQPTFTLSEVQAANTISNCLMAYNGSVYKIPSTYPEEHPGGSSSVISNCGKDVTKAFDNVHTGQSAFEQLSQYEVGILEN